MRCANCRGRIPLSGRLAESVDPDGQAFCSRECRTRHHGVRARETQMQVEINCGCEAYVSVFPLIQDGRIEVISALRCSNHFGYDDDQMAAFIFQSGDIMEMVKAAEVHLKAGGEDNEVPSD